MTWEISCADMCRACMKVDGLLLPMYDDDEIGSKNLPDKLAELTSIQIDKYDGLPNMLCAKCAYRTDAFYDFKMQVLDSERKLRKMFEAQAVCCKREEEEGEMCEEECIVQRELNEANVVDKLDVNCVNSAEASEGRMVDLSNGGVSHVVNIEIDVSELISAGIDCSETNIDLKNILSPLQEGSGIDQTKLEVIKDKIPEEISKLLEEQQLDYTIMYIPETEMDSSKQKDVEENVTLEPEIQSNMDTNISVPVSPEKDSNELENSEDCLNKMCTEDKEVQDTTEEIAESGSQTLENKRIRYENRSKTHEQNGLCSKTDARTEDSDGSDSDYFVDSRDNVLGSLNDTITRIKEIRLEDGTLQYQCTLCLHNYEKLTGVLSHTIDNHIPSTGPFFCVVCEKDCKDQRELRAHAKTHTGDYPYSCFICDKAYSMKRYLKRHMTCHTDFPRHRCPKCGSRFKTKSELESHVTTHIRGAPYSCNQCPKLFNHKGNYKRHLITHLDPQKLHFKYPCNICGKRFLNNRNLETHMRVHTGEKPYKCDVCGRSFSQQGNLLNHVRIHSNPRSYTCEVCGKQFNQRATLRDHSLLHTGEKPYVCNVCGIAFTFSAALRRHMWTHAAGKPFGCDICDARFVGKYDLKRHMKVHSDKPRAKRKKQEAKAENADQEESKEESVAAPSETDNEIVLIENVLLAADSTPTVPQEESEKENVDALFHLIQIN